MGTLSTCAAVATLSAVVIACAPRQDEAQQPNAAPPAPATYGSAYAPPPQGAAYPPGTYPPPPAPTYGQYPQPQPNPQPVLAPTAPPSPAAPAPTPPPAPAASGAMAVPGPVAFVCQNDVPCGTHHCNLQYGKCAFPCQSNVDCISPNACVMGLCVPPMPALAPPPPAAQPAH